MKLHKAGILILLLSVVLNGCQIAPSTQPWVNPLNWSYTDLRFIDSVDAVQPWQDLVALYTRFMGESFQIRMDFLDMSSSGSEDIYIAIDTNLGGSEQIRTADGENMTAQLNWDYLIVIRAPGNVKVIDRNSTPVSGMNLLFIRDISQDRMVVSFNNNVLPISLEKTRLQIIITSPAGQRVLDETLPVSIDAPPPPRAKVMFAFWNTFYGLTPAQTLRSWDGAHSGPMSSRHGLRYLVEAVSLTETPVFLLDLLKPETLSALEYIKELQRVHDLAKKGLLILNDLKESFVLLMLRENKLYSNSSDILFGGNDYANNGRDYYNCNLTVFSKTTRIETLRPSLNCRVLLVNSALSQPNYPLIFGGDFSNSILGEPGVSMDVFSYIQAHPWIQVISAYDYPSSNLTRGELSGIYTTTNDQPANTFSALFSGDKNLWTIYAGVSQQLLSSPDNPLTDLARQVYGSITQPASLPLLDLKGNYLGQIGNILFAAVWSAEPSPISTCDLDIDYDGSNECIIANKNILAIIEPNGGYLSFVFTKDQNGTHQIIGPTWEFLIGISDAYQWDTHQGVRADPDQLLGAFGDSMQNWKEYRIDLQEKGVKLYDESMTMRKSFIITGDSIYMDVQIESSDANTYTIPLAIDPWSRFSDGWRNAYILNKLTSGFQWGLISGETVQVNSTNQLSINSFNTSKNLMLLPENPNFDYGIGHYLPYPMALAKITGTGKISADIIINP